MKPAATVTSIVTAAALLLVIWSPTGAQPEVTFLFPTDGDTLAEPPSAIHLCFASAVNIKDLDEGGDFSFRVFEPTGRGLGLRIVFQPDGFGVDIYPGVPEEPEGEWTFEWRATDPDTLEPAEGAIRYTVGPGGDPPPDKPFSRCGGGSSPSTTSPTPASADDGAAEGSDGLWIGLIAAAALAGAAVLGLALYLVRRRIGPWTQRPPQQGDH